MSFRRHYLRSMALLWLFFLLYTSTALPIRGIIVQSVRPRFQIQKSPRIISEKLFCLSDEQRSRIPSSRALYAFGLPTLGIWLLQPILSLIDTSVVGLSAAASDITSLAALGPGIAWIDSSSYLCQFIGMATTNLYAIALQEKDPKKSVACLSHAFILSIVLGIVLSLLQFGLAEPIIRMLAGHSTEVVPLAVKYAKIRSVGSLFAIPTIVGQAAFLTREDSLTPLRAVLVGAIVNFVGDVVLVSWLKYGVAGAATATMLSQIAGAIYLLYKVVKKVAVATAKGKELHWWNALVKIRNQIIVPSRQDVGQFMSFCGPLFFILLAKSFLWSFTTFACSTAGSVNLAAHQITINFFLFFSIFGDTTSQMSQTYLPAFLVRSATGNNVTAGSVDSSSGGASTALDSNKSSASSVDSMTTSTDTDTTITTTKHTGDGKIFARAVVRKIIKLSVIVGAVNSAIGFGLQTVGNKVSPCVVPRYYLRFVTR